MVGLGDRHGENILIDASSGDIVHVDFSCLFDRVCTHAPLSLSCLPCTIEFDVLESIEKKGKAVCKVCGMVLQESQRLS